MKNLFHLPVCNMRQTLIRLTGCGLALLPILGFNAPTLADDAVSLKPYSAKYVTKSHGITLNLDRKLVQKADGSYKLTNGGSKFVAGFQEVSEFKQENGRIIPGSYVYQGTGLMNRRREVHFTPGADTVRSLYKDNWYDLPYTDNTFDRMSQLEQVRLLLLADDTPNEALIVTVADGKRVKDYQLDFVAEEKLETPMGVIDVLHFERVHDDDERKSDTWLAPAWDYMMVKSVHIDDGSTVEITIVSAKADGKTLTGKQ
ncbi:MAG: DUF3108 domain-containing protein [Halioglobus sp.]